jgi:hypothetical protein
LVLRKEGGKKVEQYKDGEEIERKKVEQYKDGEEIERKK